MNASEAATKASPKRLHIGGHQVKPGWMILNIQSGAGVDFVGDFSALSQFDDETMDEVYASHVIEHLSYQGELLAALKDIHRILKPGGMFRMSVPDIEVLCQLFLHDSTDINGKLHIMRMMFGAQLDEHDFHKVGLTWDFARHFLAKAGFRTLRRVMEFGIFDDTSSLKFQGVRISLNLEAEK